MLRKEQFLVCLMGNSLKEIGEAYQWGLHTLGYDASCTDGIVSPDCINLLFSGFGVPLHEYRAYGMKQGILVNCEPIAKPHALLNTPNAFQLMQHLPLWDSSRHNLEQFPKYGISDSAIQHVPIGYCPHWECIERTTQDLDVVFYGALSPRCVAVLEKLTAMGLQLAYPRPDDPWSLKKRDRYLGRAKVVLHLAADNTAHVLDHMHLGFLFANQKAVVSELWPDTILESEMRDGLEGGAIETLPERCMALCQDAARLKEREQNAYRTIRNRDWLTPLKHAIDASLSRLSTGPCPTTSCLRPTKLQIGAGRKWKYDFLNLDILPERGADVVLDLNLPLDYEKVIESWRFGKITLARESFDYILAEHVLEHIQHLTQCMRTCLDLLKDGGIFEIEVPYDLSYGAWQDPTHVRAFNERSWIYYGEWSWFFGWRDHRFDLESLVYILSPYGQALQTKGTPIEAIAHCPRAVDAIRVKLKKRASSKEEKANLPISWQPVL